LVAGGKTISAFLFLLGDIDHGIRHCVTGRNKTAWQRLTLESRDPRFNQSQMGSYSNYGSDNVTDASSSSKPMVAHEQLLSLQLVLCRYDKGRLVKRWLPVRETGYITISHAWEIATWQNIPGIEDELLVSTEKAKFIVERLPSLVRSEWFWMDVLCVNQRDKAARVAVTQHIPTIFRCAQKTIVVRNSAGLRPCCSQAVGDIKTENDLSRGQYDLVEHLLEVHLQDDGGKIQEALVERLWLLQEVILSDTIQFVQCGEALDYTSDLTPDYLGEGDLTGPSFLNYVDNIGYEIFSRACGWHDHRTGDTFEPSEFLRAFLSNGTVSRYSPAILHDIPYPTTADFLNYSNSTRRTSHARDFILAIMPQYSFYQVPQTAKQMTFGELFVDCFQQGLNAGWNLAPLVQADALSDDAYLPTDNIPEPVCLGDMAKLFLGGRIHIDPMTRKRVTEGVEVQPLTDNGNVEDAIRIVAQCIRYSPSAFSFVQPEVLLNTEIAKSHTEFKTAVNVLNYMRQHSDGSRLDTFLPLRQDPNAIPCIIQLTALISCGLGVGAYEWVMDNLTPVLVQSRGHTILALVRSLVSRGCCDYTFYLTKNEQEAWTLMACNYNVHPPTYSVGLFPQSWNKAL
jgi:Heterokaryon incompatibility protein (HET)